MSPYPQNPYGQQQQRAYSSYYNQKGYNTGYGYNQQTAAKPVNFLDKLKQDKKMQYMYGGIAVFTLIGIFGIVSLLFSNGQEAPRLDPALESSLSSSSQIRVILICEDFCDEDFIEDELEGQILTNFENDDAKLLVIVKGRYIEDLLEEDWVERVIKP